jgi:hypothetical protein
MAVDSDGLERHFGFCFGDAIAVCKIKELESDVVAELILRIAWGLGRFKSQSMENSRLHIPTFSEVIRIIQLPKMTNGPQGGPEGQGSGGPQEPRRFQKVARQPQTLGLCSCSYISHIACTILIPYNVCCMLYLPRWTSPGHLRSSDNFSNHVDPPIDRP